MKVRNLVLITLLMAMLSSVAVAEGAPMTMMGLEGADTARDWATSRFFTRMAEDTGVSFTFRQYNDAAQYQTALTEAFQTGNLPDVLFKANLTPKQEMDWLENGQLVDLAPYLAEHAPNLSKILDARPDWRRIITQPNGAIASLPILNNADRQCCVWINQSWLTALDLTMPTQVDEYTNVLRAFRDGDPNGNGQKDEIPLSLLGPWEAKFLLHAFGIVANDYNVYVDEGGEVRFAPYDDRYRAFIGWLKMCLEEGLIDPNAFRQMQGARANTGATEDKDAPITLGGMVTIAPMTMVQLDKTTNFAVLPPLAHDGAQTFRRLLNGVGRGAFAVTSACPDVPAALRWVDALYTEEGGRLAFAGLVGEDYTVNDDGTWKWSSGEDFTMLNDIVANSIIAGDATTPGLEPAAFMRNSEITDDNYARRQTDSIRALMTDPFPVTWPTDPAREARVAALQAVLGPCVDTAIANFAMGIVELNDATWQAFQDELRTLGADELVTLLQAKADEVK